VIAEAISIDEIVRSPRDGKQSRIYRTWVGMRQRCNNPKREKYKRYGARGIKVCPEWDSFENFLAWANSSGYSDDLQIDRIDNDGDYTPENCRWVTPAQNMRNRPAVKLNEKAAAEIRARYTPHCKVNGATAMAKEFGVSYNTVFGVIKGIYWS